jgi:hypothetical protein
MAIHPKRPAETGSERLFLAPGASNQAPAAPRFSYLFLYQSIKIRREFFVIAWPHHQESVAKVVGDFCSHGLTKSVVCRKTFKSLRLISLGDLPGHPCPGWQGPL